MLNIESRFKEVTGLDPNIDLTPFPLQEHIGFNIRTEEKKANGEVFTPLQLVDKMLLISKPEPTKFNMDLCAGHGQFTIRILRKFVNENPDFDVDYYLQNLHWFNEFNEDSAQKLQYIFGPNINLAIGDAQMLKHYPEENGVWLKGIFYFDNKTKAWLKEKPKEITSKPLF